MKMKIYSNILILLSGFSFAIAAQQQYSAQDLQNTYASIKQQLQSFQNTVATFPPQFQGNLPTAINNALNQVNQTYTTANAQVQPYIAQTQTARTKAIINDFAGLAINQMQKQAALIQVQVQETQSQLPKTTNGQSLNNTLQAIIDNFSSTISQINTTISSKQQDWQNRLQVIEKTMMNFSSQDKQAITIALNQAQSLMNVLNTNVNQILNTTLNDLNNLKSKAVSTNQSIDDAKQQLNERIAAAISDVNKKVTLIETVIKDAENNTAQIVAQQSAQTQGGPDYQAREEYHQKVVQFIKSAAPIIEQFLALDPLAKKAVRSNITSGQYDSATVEEITSQALHYIQLVAQAYKNNGFTVHSFDNSNYVLMMAHWLSNFFNDLIQSQIQYTKSKIKDSDYFHLIAMIAANIIGTQNAADQLVKKNGYSGIVQSIVQTYFSDTEDTINAYYAQKMVNNSFITFLNALNSMAAQWIKPTEQQLQDALLVYNQLMASVKFFPADKQSNQIVMINQSLGLLYANSAAQAIKQISLAQDSSSYTTQAMTHYGLAAQYYTNAAQAAANQSEKQKELTTIAQTYQIIANNLSQGIDNQTKGVNAENSGNATTAISYYTAAENDYKNAHDLVDATNMDIKHQMLLGNQSILSVKNRLQQFADANKEQFQQYLNYLMVQEQGPMSNFDSFMQNWLSAIQDAYRNYQQALQSYTALSNLNNAITQSTIMQQFDALNAVVQLLSMIINAQTYMSSGDQYAQNKDITSLSQANQNYAQALSLFNQADILFGNKQNILKSLFSIYPTLLTSNSAVSWNYSMLAANHIARLYVEIADQITQYDLLTAVQYYTAASHYPNLSAALKSEIQDKLQAVIKQLGQLDQLFKQAQSSQQTAEQMTDDDWKSTNENYVSTANTQWTTVINQYLSLYQLGYKAAKQAYIDALNKYADAYRYKVPEQYYPLLGSALIYYRLYLFASSQGDAQNSLLSSMQIKSNVQLYFNQARTLVTQINDPSKLSQALDNQQKLNNWYTQFKQGLEQQQLIGAPYQVPSTKILILLAQSIDPTSQIITVRDVLNNGAIQFPNMQQKSADIYKQLADADFKQQRYDQAQLEYAKAISLYHQLGNDAAANQLQQQYSISLAHMFNDLLSPQGSIKIATFTAPVSYELKVYSQAIPQQLVQQLGDPTKLSKADLTNFEISVAVSLFLYHKITDLGLDYFSLASQLSTNQIPARLSQDQQDAVLQAVALANDFKKDLTQRMAKQPTLGLRGQQQNGTSTLFLEEYYKPIPAIPSTPPIYQGYPSAYSYIYYALLLAAPPLAPGAQVQVGTTLYAPGNDPDFYNVLVNNLAQLYFSQGYSYQQALDAIKNCSSADCAWQKLKSNQNNIQATLADFMPLYNSMSETFNLMVAYYNVPFNYFAPPANTQQIIQPTAQITANFNQFLGSLYEQFGDDLQTFLIGNPLDENYNTLLTTIATQYSTAALYYNTVNKMSTLEQRTATIFTNAGDKVADQNNYFGAIGLYYIAEQALEKIASPTPDVQQKLNTVYLTRLSAAFKGATNNMVQYQTAKSTPISVKLSSGQSQSMTLDALLQDYTNWLNQNGGQTTGFDTGKLCTYNYYNGLLLDALIFYTATSIEFNKKIKTVLGGNPTDTQMNTINQNGLNVITSYMNINSISFDTLASIQQFMARQDFKNILLQGFEQFKSMAISLDTNTALQGYSALSQWASKLNTAFGQIYMNDYLGGVSVQAWDNLAEALKAETDEIRAPSKNYVGDICQDSSADY